MPFTHELSLFLISFTSKEKSCVATAARPAALYRVNGTPVENVFKNGRSRRAFLVWRQQLWTKSSA